MACDDGEVFVGDVLRGHLCGKKVCHHGCGGIKSDVDAFLIVAEACPVVLVISVVADGQVGSKQVGYRVGYVGGCLAAQTLSFLRLVIVATSSFDARHHFEQVGVVDHCAVEQQFLLAPRQLAVTFNAPRVALVEG